MRRFNSQAFLEAIASLKGMQQAMATSMHYQPGESIVIDAPGLLEVKKVLQHFCAECEVLGLTMTIRSAKRLTATLDRASTENVITVQEGGLPHQTVAFRPHEIEGVHRLIAEVSGRLADELSSRLLFQIDGDMAKYYEPSSPGFGEEVAMKFPSLTFEIEQGGKCFALGLSTASAFHFIRCLEGGIAAVSRCLNIPDPTKGHERSWNKMLSKVKDRMVVKWPGSSLLQDDARFFEEAHAALAAMQNPYRNATMHLDQKYTVEEARHIMNLVEGFMRKLAARMDENGSPLA